MSEIPNTRQLHGPSLEMRSMHRFRSDRGIYGNTERKKGKHNKTKQKPTKTKKQKKDTKSRFLHNMEIFNISVPLD